MTKAEHNARRKEYCQQVNIQVSNEDFRLLTMAAQVAGVSRPELIRLCLHDMLEEWQRVEHPELTKAAI